LDIWSKRYYFSSRFDIFARITLEVPVAKTISAYADEDTAGRVERLAKVEQRPVSQLASAALSFYVRLSEQAHAALRHVEALGSREDYERVLRNVTRVLLDAQYGVAQRAAVGAMQVDGLDDASEDDLLAEAVRVTARRTEEVAARAKPKRAVGRKRR
jgi:hypothetical protein